LQAKLSSGNLLDVAQTIASSYLVAGSGGCKNANRRRAPGLVRFASSSSGECGVESGGDSGGGDSGGGECGGGDSGGGDDGGECGDDKCDGDGDDATGKNIRSDRDNCLLLLTSIYLNYRYCY
jgi:hypothetical protein